MKIEAGKSYRTWGEMTDAEKGALLLAEENGGVLEVWHADRGEFDKPLNPGLPKRDWHIYRIKPEPVVETYEGKCFASMYPNLGPSLWLNEMDNTIPGKWVCEAIDGVPQKITWERVND